jgi:4-hydroxybenzoate polyprenyltransferase
MISVSKDTFILLRVPFSLYLAPVFLFALSQATSVNLFTTTLSFLIIHLLVYPSSNGYNSYIDKDTTSIGGIETPPLPGKELFYLTAVLDLLAIPLSFLLVSPLFALCVTLYIFASRAYSAPGIRIKKYALPGFLLVIFFQGAFSCYMALAGITGQAPEMNTALFLILTACALQIAGAYPLTQVYQHEADRGAGVRTISMLLGVKGTFIFSGIMFFLCAIAFFVYFYSTQRINQFILVLLFFTPLIIFFSRWFSKVLRDSSAANFRNTMQMNLISALCTGSCFIVLTFMRP